MHGIKKQLAFLTALAMLSSGTVTGFPVQIPAVTASESVLDFARKLAEQKVSRNKPQTFAELRYSARTKQLYQDGNPVSGNVQGFSVVDGALMYSDDHAESFSCGEAGMQSVDENYISLESAEKTIGIEIEAQNGDIVVRSPFQTGRLIVRAKNTPALHGASSVTEGYRDLHVLQYDSAADAYAAYQALQNDPDVLSVEPDRILCSEEAAGAENKYLGPRDRWGIEAIGADSYRDWLKTQKETLPEICVAVIDSGLYAEHSWMEGRVAGKGASFISGSSGTDDDNGHGSHCAGIIVQSTLDNVKILPVKVLGADGSGSTLSVYCGMMYALEQGVDAASMSLGGWGESGLYNAAVEAFAEADIPLTIAAGNDSVNSRYKAPSMCPSAITVSAVGRNADNKNKLELASFSNYGNGIDFAAPGVEIESIGTYSEDSTVYKNGTSMATPYVAACVADLLSYDPTLTNDQIYSYLKANAVDLGEPGFDSSFGWGLVNLDHFCFSDKLISAPVIHEDGTVLTDKPQLVKLTAADKDAAIYYTLDGSEPTPESGFLYDPEIGGVWIDRTETIHAIAAANGMTSKIVSKSFRASVQKPQAEYSGTEYHYTGKPVITLNGAQKIRLKGVDNAAYYYYTLDGSVPQPGISEGVSANDGIPITENCVLTVRVQTDNGLFSDPFSFTFEVYAEAPSYSIGEDGTLHMQTSSESDAIYYTLDGSEPIPEKSMRYEQPIALTASTHVRAVTVSGKAVSVISDYAHIVDGKDTANALVIKDGVLVSYTGILTSLDLSAETFTAVGEKAFAGNSFLNDVTLPKTCTKLGAYAFSDMQALMEVNGGSITEISEGTFKDSTFLLKLDAVLTEIPAYGFCHSGMPLKNANIKTVGDYGLYDNPAAVTKENGIVWEGVESIGNYGLAFSETAGILYDGKGIATGKLDLKSLKAIGKYAFLRNNNIAELILPASLTTAPEGMLMNVQGLNVLKAPGITALEDYAFAFTPEAPDGIAVDFSKMTKLGKQSLRGFVMLHDTEFSALTVLGEDTFAEGYFSSLSFPKVKTVPENAFATEQYIDALYFENAETVEKNAFILERNETEENESAFDYSSEGDFGYDAWTAFYAVRCIIFGSKLKNLDKKAFADSTAGSVMTVAAPKDSPVFRTNIPSQTVQTPSVAVFPESDAVKRMNPTYQIVPQHTGCVLRAVPLGFGVNVQWFALPDDGYTQWLNGTPVSGANGLTLHADTAHCGKKRYYAAVVTDGAVGSTSDIITVETAEIKSAGTVKTNETLILDYSGQPMLDSYRYLSCTYTPEADGAYIFTRGFIAGGYIVIDADGNIIAENTDEGYIHRYDLEGGKTYTIYVQSDMENYYDYFRILPVGLYGTLRSVTTTETDLAAPVIYMGQPVYPECSVYWSNMYQRNAKTGKTELKDPVLLTKDKDYVLRYEEFPDQDFGRLYVFGIGDYEDFKVFSYEMQEGSNYYTGLTKLTAGTPLTVRNLNQSVRECLIQPAKTGYYSLSLNYTEDTLQHFFNGGEYGYPEAVDPVLHVGQVSKNGLIAVAEDDNSNGIMMPFISRMYLEKGKSYIVQVYNNENMIPLYEAELLLETAQDNTGYISNTDSGDEFQYQMHFYTGEAQEPDLSLWDKGDGTVLVRGVDYDAYYFNNTEQGYMSILAAGKGRYHGYKQFGTVIQYDHWNASGNIAEIETDKEFTLQNSIDCFMFPLREDSYISMVIPENAAFSGLLQQLDADMEWECWNDLLQFREDSFNCDTPDGNGGVHHGRFLKAGTYYFVFRHAEGSIPMKLHLEASVPDLSLAECAPVSCSYTGASIHPELNVIYGDTVLKEGTDYEIVLPEGTLDCGVHTLMLRGIGSFSGTLYVEVTVCPALELAGGNELKEGETVAEITKEKRTAYYYWKPAQTDYRLWSDQNRGKNILIYEPDGHGSFTEYDILCGIGSQYREIHVSPGTTYLVTASFSEQDVTGALAFHVSSTVKLLDACEIDGPETAFAAQDGGSTVPEFSVKDGDKVLEAGKDYAAYAYEGNTEYGRACVRLKGIGDYTGTLDYVYYVAPVVPETVSKREPTKLLLDQGMRYVLYLPGYSYRSVFTAPKDGTYYLEIPDSVLDGASALLYDNEQHLLPMNTRSVTLRKGETLTVVSVTNFASPTYNMSSSYVIRICSEKQDHIIYADGFSLRVHGDTASVIGFIDWDLSGLAIPDTFYDSKYDTEVAFSGIDADLYSSYMGRPVIYCKSGSLVEKYCRDLYYNYLVTDAVSTVKGDVSGDGAVDRRDAEILQRWMTELKGMQLPDFAYKNADMNGDGYVDILDVTAIIEYVHENGIAAG